MASPLWLMLVLSLNKDYLFNYVGLLHHPFWLQLVLALFGRYFSTFYTTCLAKDHEGSVPEMRIWSISLI